MHPILRAVITESAAGEITKEAEDRKASRVLDYLVFTKFRLAGLVIFSAVLGYLAAAEHVNWLTLIALTLGGSFITASANGLNQIYERERDKLMQRTFQRPLPQHRISVKEAYIACILFAIAGFILLYWFCNPLTAVLSLGSLLIYAYVYTPLKPVTPLAVFVGAIPGALPPLLGFTAADNSISFDALIWFFIQFMWQFPHFWAIAWRGHEDYLRGGFYLLPLRNGKTRENAAIIFFYTLMNLPVALLPYFFGISGLYSSAGIFVMNVFFIYYAYRLYSGKSDKDATKLMFASFFYLPVVQILLFLNL